MLAVGAQTVPLIPVPSAATAATADKETFLSTWDPIASAYGLEQFNASQI